MVTTTILFLNRKIHQLKNTSNIIKVIEATGKIPTLTHAYWTITMLPKNWTVPANQTRKH